VSGVSKQTDAQGETTFNPHDKDPHRRKVQLSKSTESSVRKPSRTGAVKAKKHVDVFSIRERRKNLPLTERNQVTIGEFVYKKSKSQYPPLYGKWHKHRKGDNRILETVDSLPIEEKYVLLEPHRIFLLALWINVIHLLLHPFYNVSPSE